MFQCSLHSLHDEMFITKDRRVLHSVLLVLLLAHGGQEGGAVSTVVLELSISLTHVESRAFYLSQALQRKVIVDCHYSLRVDETLGIAPHIQTAAVYVLHHVKVVRHIHFTYILFPGQPKLVVKEVNILKSPGNMSVLLTGEMSHKLQPG